MKKYILIVLVSTGFNSILAQSNLLNAKTPDQIGKKSEAQLISDNYKPLPYGYVHDRDVLMGKTVWETIDLNERINFPLLYPTDTTNVGKDRRSLFTVLIKNIKNGNIKELYSDEYFNTKKTLKDLESVFKYVDTTDAGREEINNFRDLYFPKATPLVVKKDKKGNIISQSGGGSAGAAKILDKQFINTSEFDAGDIVAYLIKGYWYFDKRQSELKYRLLGICPYGVEARDKGKDTAEPIPLFWIYFPSIRDILHEANAFNDRNSAMPVSFDHLLNSRRFNAVITREENGYGDRDIKAYLKDNAQSQLLESDRVKEKIRDFESDMWNY